jgi:hypothetical protein
MEETKPSFEVDLQSQISDGSEFQGMDPGHYGKGGGGRHAHWDHSTTHRHSSRKVPVSAAQSTAQHNVGSLMMSGNRYLKNM